MGGIIFDHVGFLSSKNKGMQLGNDKFRFQQTTPFRDLSDFRKFSALERECFQAHRKYDMLL